VSTCAQCRATTGVGPTWGGGGGVGISKCACLLACMPPTACLPALIPMLHHRHALHTQNSPLEGHKGSMRRPAF
jgi:hypothetical protein